MSAPSTTPRVGPLPLAADDQPPPGRYCDLVMKGGVTDGVVYPWAILELARQYRFQSIGGTSVGAVAAALTAASEYSRRYGSLKGFNQVLLEVPQELAKAHSSGGTRLRSLFQPVPGARALLELLIAAASGAPGWRAIGSALAANYLPWPSLCLPLAIGLAALGAVGALASLAGLAAVGLLPLLQAALSAWAWASLPSSLAWTGSSALALLGASLLLCLVLPLLLLGATSIRLARDLREHLGGQGMGLCTGLGQPGGLEGFTDWLHQGIQAASGRPLSQPLTFRDLWQAPGGPDPRPQSSGLQERPRSIDLQMMSTNLTQGRACGFPLSQDSGALFFREQEFAAYFPPEILQHLCRCSPLQTTHPDWGLRALPQGELPVVVAARLSLSFPVLFKALPLWSLTEGGAPYRCWFSDGGICANFPIHLFDALLPRWPTFGISLVDQKWPGGPDLWIVPACKDLPEQPYPPTPPGPTAPAWGHLLDFLSQILTTARKWNDNASVRLPGVRERVVNIYLDPQRYKGGLNLNLGGTDILQLAAKGQAAGQLLVDQFLVRPEPAAVLASEPSQHWHAHRWLRFTTFVNALQVKIAGFQRSATQAVHAQPLAHMRSQIQAQARLTPAQSQALAEAQTALEQLEHSLNPSTALVQQPAKPRPQAELRLRAPL